jgi:hypothetical protein
MFPCQIVCACGPCIEEDVSCCILKSGSQTSFSVGAKEYECNKSGEMCA